MRTTILVLANQTASSEELFSTLEAKASKTPVRLEFVVPPVGPDPASRADAEKRLEEALQHARGAGMEATGIVGDCDALAAVVETYDPGRHDEIVVSTLPASISHWMGIDLPARIARTTDALVTHVATPEDDRGRWAERLARSAS
ncbi:MAG: hypothetical protein AVDCRST_MAG38-1727 [uncultured Solirubrobacteraceae bacterium]|uniref:UspA domain-containing protein n=1 Tax=uncultured Solirubrobacteraceae bacterium TaxID=1162706 RepID=A0A6J4RM20_9ACTN|nr:MAG: hypothetical protein AVDCRST_MAG38-1727 [uncultured Solirubrobacteraceae bacterium]